jgi:ABC-2 type transport system ATP-binding protein
MAFPSAPGAAGDPGAVATAPPPDGAVVVAQGVAKRWGRTQALHDVDLAIGRGVTGLLGANGAGKTSFLRLVLGQHRVDAGRLVVLGEDPWTAGPEVRARIGWSPEHDALPPDVRAQDVVRHLAELHGLPPRDALERASEALGEVGLAEERFRPVGTMSTGQKQRVKLAQAIAHDPTLVLLDEPTNGLDPVQRDGMLALIRRVSEVFGLDVVVSSHLLGEVERICDSVVLLDGGRVAAAGRVRDLTRREGTLLVQVGGGADRLAAALAGAGLRTEVRPGEAVLVELAADDSAYDLVRDACVDLGLELRRLSQRSATLEDLFLAAADERERTAAWSQADGWAPRG